MATAPYPLLSDVMNSLRVSVNDAIVSLGGQTLINTKAFTPVYANRGYQLLQQWLLSKGYVRLKVTNYLFPNLPPVANEDTSLQVSLSWSGYNDGVTDYSNIFLPKNCIKPLRLAERPSDTAPNVNPFIEIDFPKPLPNVPKQPWNQIANWGAQDANADEQLTMPGATVITDLTMDYAAFLPDFVSPPVGTFPGTQVVPIMRSTDALAWAIAYVFCFARGDADAPAILANFHDAAAIIANVPIPSEIAQQPTQ